MPLKVLQFGLSAVSRSSQRTKVILQHIRAMSSANDEVLLQKVDTKGVITLNRPKALNALNLNMIRMMQPQVNMWKADPETTMVIIKGAGGKAFCAGGDIRAVTEAGKIGDPLSEQFFKEEYILNHTIGTLPIPWVAFIDGITMGGGVGLSVHGKYRIATEKTVFAMPETAIGLFPDVGGGHFLPSLLGQEGLYLALTGYRLKGRDVQLSGVATHFVESTQLESLEQELLSLKVTEPEDIDHVIQSYHDKCTIDKDKEFSLKTHMTDINRFFNKNTLEEIFSALEADGGEWATKQLNTLKKMSPTSMKVTLRQLRQGGSMTLADDLTMEYRISQRCMEDKDFYEGVRAVLVDRDNSPKWDPATIEGVTDEKVDWYFSPLPEERELKF